MTRAALNGMHRFVRIPELLKNQFCLTEGVTTINLVHASAKDR